MSKHEPFRVLSIDGGGMRGLYSATYLSQLAMLFNEKNRDKSLDIGKNFDLIVGTSTGAIIACALAAGIPCKKVIELYTKDGPKIFKSSMPSSGLKFFVWAMSHLFRPGNKNTHLTKVLLDLFKEETLGSIYSKRKIALCIPTVNLMLHKPRVFKTPHLDYLLDRQLSVVDACLATSAAPIYLPSHQFTDSESDNLEYYCDGGLWANNPTLIAIIEAMELAKENQKIEIISIGTNATPEATVLSKPQGKQGLWFWKAGARVLSVSMDVQDAACQFTVGKLVNKLKCNCHVIRLPSERISLDHAKSIGLDKATNKSDQVLKSLGKQDANVFYGKIKNSNDMTSSIIRSIFSDIPIINE